MAACQHCQAEVSAIFCGECGTRQGAAAVSAPPQLPPPPPGPPTAPPMVLRPLASVLPSGAAAPPDLLQRVRTAPPAVLVGVAVALVAVIALGLHVLSPFGGAVAVSGAGSSPSTVQLSGSMTVTAVHGSDTAGSSVEVDPDGSCSAGGGFDDVNAGTAVTVYDKTGTIIATTSLGAGVGTAQEQSSQFPDIYIGTCVLPFSVQVPASDFYQVEVSHRGRITVSKAEAGDVKATLGD